MRIKRILSTVLSVAMVFSALSMVAFADAVQLPEPNAEGVITLTEDVTLSGETTVDETIVPGEFKIHLNAGATLTVSGDSPVLYDSLQAPTEYLISYTLNDDDTVTYTGSDIEGGGYNVFMCGYPSVVNDLGDGNSKHLLISYTRDGKEYFVQYISDVAAVVTGGVWHQKNVALESTSITLRSGTLAALVGGTKTGDFSGAVGKATINIEGGEVVGDPGCSKQPYASQGMIMPIWYQGPDVGEFEFNMIDGEVEGTVYGGAVTSTSPKNFNTTVGKFTANISGGEITDALYVGPHTENQCTHTVDNVNVNISGNAKIGTVYGGGFALYDTKTGSKSVVNNVSITVDDDAAVDTIFAGGQNGTDAYSNTLAESTVGNAEITVNSPNVSVVYGGGKNRRWLDYYKVVQGENGNFQVVQNTYDHIKKDSITHYSNVDDVTLNINESVDALYLGGSSWAHVEKATANVNAIVNYISCIGKFGYVENAEINISETGGVADIGGGVVTEDPDAAAGSLDLVRSGIVGNITIENNGTIEHITAGAPEGSYKDNMGDKDNVAIIGDVNITNNGTVDDAFLTFGLEYAREVNVDVPLKRVEVAYSKDNTKDGTTEGDPYKKEDSQWNATVIGASAPAEAEPDVEKKVTFEQIKGTNEIKVFLEGANADGPAEIKNLMAIDLKFAITPDADSSFKILDFKPAADNWTSLAAEDDRYLIHEDGRENGENDLSGAKIILGTLTIGGFGKGTIEAAYGGTENPDHAVEQRTTNGIVYSSVIDSASYDFIIEKTKAKLTVNVTFPNEVFGRGADDTDMKVTITGGLLTGVIAFELGTDQEDEGVTYTAKDSDANAVYRVTTELPADLRYTVTVEGAGYRTVRHDLFLDGDKELTFWNNVMDKDTVVEEGKPGKKVTFLAGDIVKDNNINIYDLSAVVSYFGSDSASGNGYATTYDLNRDGVIDSKDIAYVLVSWGN